MRKIRSCQSLSDEANFNGCLEAGGVATEAKLSLCLRSSPGPGTLGF